MTERMSSLRVPARPRRKPNGIGNGLGVWNADAWVETIVGEWRKAVGSIIQTGRLLREAKDALGYGAWGKMVDDKLPFGMRTAQCLISIAEHPIIGNAKFVSHLPPSWGCLQRMCHLPDEALKDAMADGRINPSMTRKDVDRLIEEIRRAAAYIYSQVPEALCTLTKFARHWEDPTEIAGEVLDHMLEGDHAIETEELAELIGWLSKLRKSCEIEQRKLDELLDADW